MPRLPRISGAEAVRAFERSGWRVSRQSDSHVVMLKAESIVSLSIPLHRELGPGLLSSQIKKAGLSVDEFIGLL
ncbi:type II toxin-antitoxin system HicA family toxin [Candidatus Amarobacter glycogenicus]|uniref:type II toxin-antitoxin system HicA family toxin n=1 Tax=Candidatus Amarobacter glycogenicus TaxID=3140699 RepID=UPI003134E163|nr:type II toxin-antitoxin system HicA family toxin [Dehalococcoidia bacterium]